MRSWTEKQRNIIDFTLSSLARRKGRNIALALIYTFVVFQLASVMFFTHALRREASLVLRSAPEMVVQRMVAGRHDPIPRAHLDAVRDIRGVSSAHGRLWGYYFDPVTGANYTLLVPGEFAYGRGEIAIGQAIARLWHSSVGDLLTFRRYDGTAGVFAVREILSPESELVSSDLVLLSEQDFREFFGMSSALYTDIVLTVRNASEVASVAGEVQEFLPDTRPITKSEILQTYDTLVGKVEGLWARQGFLEHAAVIFIWTAIPYRTEWRYTVVAPKIIAQDSGHLCQNLYLACEAIGAGTCAIGAYDQARMDAFLGVDGEEELTLYLAPVGRV
jgi:nitroreductase